MLEDGLQDAERPAEALAHEAVHVDRGLGEGQRLVLVDDLVALFEQVHGEVGVFGDGVGVVSAAGLDRRGAPRADGPGNHHDHVEEVQRAALEVLAGDVLERLPARPQVDAVAHLGVAGDRADLRVGEVADQVGDGVVRDDAVGVDADVDLLAGLGEREVERVGLASVGLGQHGQPAGGDLRRVGVDGGLDRCCPFDPSSITMMRMFL